MEETTANTPVETTPTETISAAEPTPIAEEKPAGKTYTEAEYNALLSQIKSRKKSAKANEDFKKKFEESEQARKDFEYNTKISAFVKSLNLKNDIYENHVVNYIKEKNLQFDGNKLIGGDDVVSNFKEKYADAFKEKEPLPKFADKTTSAVTPKTDDAVLRAVMGLK